MTRNEAKAILLLCRPDTADADDSQVAEALAVAQQDSELADWLERQRAEQQALRQQFRKLTAPAGLKEQIISEQAAQEKSRSWLPKLALPALAVSVVVIALATFWFVQRGPAEDTLTIYQNRMAGIALRGYAMDVVTNDTAAIRTFLAQHHAPSNFVLPKQLQPIALTGCAVEDWQGVKVSMICFRTGKPLPAGIASDLWLFVVDRSAVKRVPNRATPDIATVNRLITATWTEGDKLYLLGTEGDAAAIQQYL